MPVPGAGGTGVSDGVGTGGVGVSDGVGTGGVGVSDGVGTGAGLVHVPSDQTHPRDVQFFSPVQSLHSAHVEPPEPPPVTNLWTIISINTTAIKPPIHNITRVVLLILAIRFFIAIKKIAKIYSVPFIKKI
tara:strand:- start:4017 stop:4409 length:393 start_codon:yes stop_codon:yes gene_type:complete